MLLAFVVFILSVPAPNPCQDSLHFAHLPSASSTTLWGAMPVTRVPIGCTAHKIVYLPGSSTPTAPLYAVIVSTEV